MQSGSVLQHDKAYMEKHSINKVWLSMVQEPSDSIWTYASQFMGTTVIISKMWFIEKI